MENRLTTLLETTSNIIILEELLVAPNKINSIGKTVNTLMVESDQKAFEEYISSSSETPAASHPLKMAGIKSHAHAQPSPIKVREARAAGQGAQGVPSPSPDLPQVVVGSTSSCDAQPE